MLRGPLFVMCLAACGWGFSFGIGTQGVTHWLKDAGRSDTLIGLMHATYYLGVAGASLLVPALTRRFGMACTFWGMLLSAATLALFPLTQAEFFWYACRLLSGVGCAFSLIPMETFLSKTSAPQERTRNFSYYAVALTLGGALGIAAALGVYDGHDGTIFWLGAGSALGAALLARIATRTAEGAEPSRPAVIDWTRNFLSFGTAWSQGFLEGGMLAFLALYLEGRGLSQESTGLLMGLAMVGVIACQVPIAWIADRVGARPALLGCYAVALAGLIAVPTCSSLPAMGVWLFAFGAFTGAMYPLGLSLLGERTAESDLPRAYAAYLALECVGSQCGAPAMGWARDAWGPNAMFVVGVAALSAVLLGWTLTTKRQASRRSVEIRRAA